jgi:hypothetical protein
MIMRRRTMEKIGEISNIEHRTPNYEGKGQFKVEDEKEDMS